MFCACRICTSHVNSSSVSVGKAKSWKSETIPQASEAHLTSWKLQALSFNFSLKQQVPNYVFLASISNAVLH